MKSVVESISDQALRELATASDFRLGKEIFEGGDVEVVEMKPSEDGQITNETTVAANYNVSGKRRKARRKPA